MTDNDELLRAFGRISRMETRRRVNHDLAVVAAAKKAGFPVAEAVVDGVRLQFSEPAKAPAAQPAAEKAEEPPRSLFTIREKSKVRVVL